MMKGRNVSLTEWETESILLKLRTHRTTNKIKRDISVHGFIIFFLFIIS